MRVAGIDPGKSGALAVVSTGSDHAVVDLTLIVPTHVVKAKERADFTLLRTNWGPVLGDGGVEHVFIEQVGAMPGQGVTSMFTFGYVAGFMYGLVQSGALPHTFITPQSWKKIVGISGSDKGESRRRASQLFPASANLFVGKRDGGVYTSTQVDGVADACLIAYAGLMKLQGKA